MLAEWSQQLTADLERALTDAQAAGGTVVAVELRSVLVATDQVTDTSPKPSLSSDSWD